MKTKVTMLPVSQRDLAAYLNISGTLMSMTNTGRHGSRKLAGNASGKLVELIKTHIDSQIPGSENPSLKKLKASSAKERRLLAETWSHNAAYSRSHAETLKRELEEMRDKYTQDSQWLRTVDLALEKIAAGNQHAKNRPWFKNQQLITMKRLQKNGPLAQARLQLKIEVESAKALIYKKMEKALTRK